jgi:hypothetical protein
MVLATDATLAWLSDVLAALLVSPAFSGWRRMGRLLGRIRRREARLAQLMASLKQARGACEAGIARGQRFKRPPRLPYYSFVVLILAIGHARPAAAQDRQVFIILDASVSVGRGAAGPLFREYLAAVRRQLATLPANTDAQVLAVSGEPLGNSLLRHLTPPPNGVFRAKLLRSRQAAVEAFDRKASGLRPAARRSDIVGVLARVAIARSGSSSCDVIVHSDARQESPLASLRAILAGPDKSLKELQKAQLVPNLRGCRLRFSGVATTGMDLHQWASLRRFWRGFADLSGATLVSFEPTVQIH